MARKSGAKLLLMLIINLLVQIPLKICSNDLSFRIYYFSDKYLWWVDTSLQLSATQLLTHSPPGGMRKRTEARKLVGQDKDSLIRE